MATFPFYLSGAPGVTLSLSGNETNGKVTGFTCDNQSPWLVHGVARLTDGRVFERDFPVGSTTLALPVNVLSVQTITNDEGEVVQEVVGLAGYSLEIRFASLMKA